MGQQHFFIPRTPDARLVSAFKKVAKKYPPNQRLTFVTLGSMNGTVPQEGEEGDATWKMVSSLATPSYVIWVFSATYGSFSVHFYRGGKGNETSAYLDLVEIHWRDDQPQDEKKLAVVAEVQRLLGVAEPRAEDEDQGRAAAHEAVLNRLETLNENLIQRSSEFRQQLEKQHEQKRSELELEFEKRKAAADQEVRSREAGVLEREEELQRRLREIDTRDNTIVRRSITEGLLNEVKGRLVDYGVSASTRAKRAPVRFGILAAIVLLLIFTAVTYIDLDLTRRSIANYRQMVLGVSPLPGASSRDTAGAASQIIASLVTEEYVIMGRLVLLTLGLFGVVLYYIRWENAWATRHADSEFRLQQFHLDINRASWVIESCLEWKKETDGAEIPPELLSSVTRTLFVDQQHAQDVVVHPADELASALLGSAAKLKLKAGDSELEFNKPGKTIPKNATA